MNQHRDKLIKAEEDRACHFVGLFFFLTDLDNQERIHCFCLSERGGILFPEELSRQCRLFSLRFLDGKSTQAELPR